MDHRDIISKLKKYKIPHGPITESTKKLYLKKIQSFEQHTCNKQLNEPSNLEQILEKGSFFYSDSIYSLLYIIINNSINYMIEGLLSISF